MERDRFDPYAHLRDEIPSEPPPDPWGHDHPAHDERVHEEGDVHRPPGEPVGLDEVHEAFRRWLGPHFDLSVVDVVLAVNASGLYLNGDTIWLQLVGGPGVGKTETLSALAGTGAKVISTISGEAALLSGTPVQQRAKAATGGLLRSLGSSGVLVIKDFTSILAMHRDKRGEVLSALREVYDGRWTRNLGTDGGLELTWEGRVTVVSGVTGTYDEHHAVISAMGDRFLLMRLDSEDPRVRQHAARQAIINSGGEDPMRHDLEQVVTAFMASIGMVDFPIEDDLITEIYHLSDLVSRSRSDVAKDDRGEPQYAHAPEMPTRIGKQFVMLYRGSRLIGLSDLEARAILRRVAHDSIPPGRRKALLAVHDHPASKTTEIAEFTDMSFTTADRRLQELSLHNLVRREKVEEDGRTPWRWWPAVEVDLDLLRGVTPETSGGTAGDPDRHETAGHPSTTDGLWKKEDISGVEPKQAWH